MYERRESYRFSIPPGGDQAMVTVDGAVFPARLLDTSAGGLSLRIQEPVECKIGQKVDVELGEQDFNLTQVVRVEKDESATTLRLMRLKDQRWDEMDQVPKAPIRQILKRKRRDWLPGSHAAAGALLLIVGMAIGFLVWRPQLAPELPGDKLSGMAPPQRTRAPSAKPTVSKPVPQAAPAPHSAPARMPKAAKKPATAPAAGSPQEPVSVASVPLKPPSAAEPPKSALGDFQRLLPRLPRTVQFQFRQLEAEATSPGPRGAWLQTQQEVERIVERLQVQLTSVFEQSGSDEPALNKAAQPLIDDARRQIDRLHGNGPPQREVPGDS